MEEIKKIDEFRYIRFLLLQKVQIDIGQKLIGFNGQKCMTEKILVAYCNIVSDKYSLNLTK